VISEKDWIIRLTEMFGELIATIDTIKEHGEKKELMDELFRINHKIKKMMQ
jgi:hypothetical protein